LALGRPRVEFQPRGQFSLETSIFHPFSYDAKFLQTVRKLLCKDRRLFPGRRATADFARFDLEGGL